MIVCVMVCDSGCDGVHGGFSLFRGNDVSFYLWETRVPRREGRGRGVRERDR